MPLVVAAALQNQGLAQLESGWESQVDDWVEVGQNEGLHQLERGWES
jgi:hypothetical protein